MKVVKALLLAQLLSLANAASKKKATPVTPASTPDTPAATDAPTSAPTEAGPEKDLDESCLVYFNPNSGGEGKFKEYSGNEENAYPNMCMSESASSPGTYLSCIADDMESIENAGNGWNELTGTCQSSMCSGYVETDEIDTNTRPEGENSATIRVTICHRTCSQTNPWVRITVDSSALWGAGCGNGGHLNEHHVREDCFQDDPNADLSAWGGKGGDDASDFIIRWHGRRDEVATNFTSGSMVDGDMTFATEKDYWRYWERACPAVREGKGANSCCFGDHCCGYSDPTPDPTSAPTSGPTSAPTKAPEPTSGPTSGPTETPSRAPVPVVIPDALPPDTPTEPAGSQGDPHFRTWHNEHFEYHGQCDLVLAKDANFADGLGLDVQIRTKLVRFWSYIKSAAVRIGNDVFEVEGTADSDGAAEIKYWYNMELNNPKMETVGGFPIVIHPSNKGPKQIVEIDLTSKYPGAKIEFQIWKEFVKINFVNPTKEAFGNCVGMLGDFESGKTLARDRSTEMNDYYKLGNEWQVLPTDMPLFHKMEQPQFPSKCIEPEDPRGERMRRRLDESSVSVEDAEQACNALTDELDRKDCVYDILATQDMDLAGAY